VILRVITVIVLIILFFAACQTRKREVTGVLVEHSKPAGKKKSPPQQPVSNGVADWQQKIGISSRQVPENKLYSFINDWYGVPYRYGGCQKSGVDCSCFTSLLCETVYGMKLARTADQMFRECELITPEQAQEGDLYFFRMNGKTVTHVGVCVKDNYFIHSSTSKGVILSSLGEPYYKKYFYSAGRVKGK
jgi:cell wall-associated NlpC family hydrolase